MDAAKQVLAEVSKLDTEGELAKLILAMYEKILNGATLYDLRRAADELKASTLKPIVYISIIMPPLCKGRWQKSLILAEGVDTIPQSASQPAPFTQGGLYNKASLIRGRLLTQKVEMQLHLDFLLISLFRIPSAGESIFKVHIAELYRLTGLLAIISCVITGVILQAILLTLRIINNFGEYRRSRLAIAHRNPQNQGHHQANGKAEAH